MCDSKNMFDGTPEDLERVLNGLSARYVPEHQKGEETQRVKTVELTEQQKSDIADRDDIAEVIRESDEQEAIRQSR